MQFGDTLYGAVKNGVLVLSGYIASVTTEHGSLVIKDGIKGNVAERTYSRAHCPISRIISTQTEGYISFSAVRWLHEIGASIAHLHYDGTPLLVSVPQHAVPAAIQRKQALLTLDTPLGAAIARRLLLSKAMMQVALMDLYAAPRADEARDYVQRLMPDTPILKCEHTNSDQEKLNTEREPLVSSGDLPGLTRETPFLLNDALGAEGIVSLLYWQSLADRPVNFGLRQNIPDHWRTFGARHSPLTSNARTAVTPGNALLNYIYGVCASELSISLHALGINPALGLLHTDKDDRASLAYDLIEPARPLIDRWFFHWLQSMTFSKRDFIEGTRGEIRIMRPLSTHLAMTASLWRGLSEQLAGWFFRCLESERVPPLKLTFVDIKRDVSRRAIRWTIANAIQRPIPTTCRECGKTLPERRRKFCSNECQRSWYGGTTAGLAGAKRAQAARAATGVKRRPNTVTVKAMPLRAWRLQPGWTAAADAEIWQWFKAVVLPLLSNVRPSDLQRATGVSKQYAIELRQGVKIPHPRHVRLIADFVGVEYPFQI
jgi:CRISPR-associated endonuclease Cas1